jgi:hypothetical protein
MAQVEARKLKHGQRVRTATGEVIKVLNSNPERQSAGSGSSSAWEVCGYSEGKPTRRAIVGAGQLFEVVDG